MTNQSIIRSPFFYVGDKYKLMGQLKCLFPHSIERYIEPFAGGGSSFLNTSARKRIVNDVDSHIIELHKWLSSFAGQGREIFGRLFDVIDSYGLTCSYRGRSAPDELKAKYVKTYYARYNKSAYEKMRLDYNKSHDVLLLYLLLIYGFNHTIRFNAKGMFNLPVGNVDFNANVYDALCGYLSFMENNRVEFHNEDYKTFLSHIDLDANCYVYMDPPYLISGSEYNKLWNVDKEYALCETLDSLDRAGIRFGVTNLVCHKGAVNTVFAHWARKYFSHVIKSNYISFNDNTIKDDSIEVFVTNVPVRQESKYIADLSLSAANRAYSKQEEFSFV